MIEFMFWPKRIARGLPPDCMLDEMPMFDKKGRLIPKSTTPSGRQTFQIKIKDEKVVEHKVTEIK